MERLCQGKYQYQDSNGPKARVPVGSGGGSFLEVYVTDDAQLVTSVPSTRVSWLTGEKFALCYLCKFAKERKLPDKLKLDVQLV